ncbi:MAG: radical SAM protein [Candidatus Eisenbacteria bacterium]|uniref:Radical SAM protein n=1 Tax=Eiseniibacteriota bacterium TaxID=2212470 RepID=A0A956N900_UNCEI|nr:radical SAM protein [Candidatus Eisenbacteria bacterium]MCB9465233.1 radical SAM protein [Candidatus Eisenbacteria bacterium]
METDIRYNPGLLKLELYCKGIRLDDSFFKESKRGRQIMRTRAGLGSGLELVLEDGLWTNVPVVEPFAANSPYLLFREGDDGETLVIRRDGDREKIAEVELSPKPSWYERNTEVSGKPMTRVGSLQGTYLGVYPSKVCEYWLDKPEKTNCKFCSVGLNLGADDADEKSVEEVLEVAIAARDESKITYVDFNTGHYTGETYLDILEPYIRRLKEETGLLIGVQTPPHADLSRYDRLKEMGVNRVSFCFEIWDEERFIDVCPGKHREYGLKRYLDAVKYCAEIGKRRGPFDFDAWVSNGEIIAGLEKPEDSMAAIDWITENGAIPTVCVFRPLKATDYADVPPPKTEDMIPVFARLYEACMDHDLPIGVAPNVHVSLVLLPEEGRYFTSKPQKYRWKEMKLKAQKTVYRKKFLHDLETFDRRRAENGGRIVKEPARA